PRRRGLRLPPGRPALPPVRRGDPHGRAGRAQPLLVPGLPADLTPHPDPLWTGGSTPAGPSPVCSAGAGSTPVLSAPAGPAPSRSARAHVRSEAVRQPGGDTAEPDGRLRQRAPPQ